MEIFLMGKLSSIEIANCSVLGNFSVVERIENGNVFHFLIFFILMTNLSGVFERNQKLENLTNISYNKI